MSKHTAQKDFEFEGCIFTCIATVDCFTQYHPYGSTVAGESMTDVDEVKWLFDGEPITQEDVEFLLGCDVEDWIDETVSEGTYANDGQQEEPEWDD